METWQLVEDNALWLALANAGGSLAAGLVAVVLGAVLARQLV
jgi:fluoride ion exporter CrcB/FEX